MDPLVTCQNCGTKLRVRAVSLRYIKDIQCTKCRQSIPIPADLRPGAPADTPTAPAPESAEATPVTVGTGTLSFPCEGCGRKMVIMKIYAGKRIKCPGCQHVNQVPAIPATATAQTGKAPDGPPPAASTTPPSAASPSPQPPPPSSSKEPEPTAQTPPPMASPSPESAAPPKAEKPVPADPPKTVQPAPAPPPPVPASDARTDLLRFKKEVRVFLEEQLQDARNRVTKLERRLSLWED